MKKLSFVVLSLLFLSPSLALASVLSACPAEKLQASKTLAEINNQWVYVDFWASWCGPCRQTFPLMNELEKQYKDRLQIVAISVDDNAGDAKKFLQKYPAQFPVYLDVSGLCPEVFNVKGMPSSYLISPKGKIVFSETGFTAKSQARIQAVIKKALASAPITN